ncbi:MAG: permease prefix domain 1-containing protein [Bifidobacteriaceae bacterium]|nr:permease prefix domain 1-containing protein [Bifidobacteriaceae bacterium]
MNVVIAYLETMFSVYPQTPRLQEAKAELQAMMEDAYTGLIAEGRAENEAVGQVIRDFGNLEEVAPVLGIASDISPLQTDAVPFPPITLEEAQGYADAYRRTRRRVSAALTLFVLSPAILILLPVAAESGLAPITDGVGVFIGIVVLLLLVGVGLLLLLAASRDTAPYRRITERRFAANPVVTRWAEALAERHERGRTRALQTAIALAVLAPVPTLAFALFLDGSAWVDFWTVVGVVFILAVVAVGLGILLPRSWAHDVSEKLGPIAPRRK